MIHELLGTAFNRSAKIKNNKTTIFDDWLPRKSRFRGLDSASIDVSVLFLLAFAVVLKRFRIFDTDVQNI